MASFEETKPTYPPSLKEGDKLTIESFSIGETEYESKMVPVATIQTKEGERSTFSSVIISQLEDRTALFDSGDSLTCSVVKPKGKRYLSLA